MGYLYLGGGGSSGASSTPTPKQPIVGIPQGQQPQVHVRDLTQGWDLYLKDADAISEYPASCCKLMTAMLCYEYKNAVLDDTVTVTTADCTQPAGYTTDFIGFQNGDVVSWRELLYAMLLPSAGDAAQCIARIIGTELFVAAGSTGNTGMTRFVERMNERATELGMTGTVFVTPFGGSRLSGTVRSKMSPRSLSLLCEETLSNAELREIAVTPSIGITVTGGRTTTITATNYNRFCNGPTFSQAGVSDPTCLGGKNGTWTDGDAYYNLSMIWQAPNGNEIVITTIGSQSLFGLMLDQRGIQYQLVRDFPYLLEGVDVGTDPHWSNVKAMISATEGTISDESTENHTLLNTSVAVGSGIVADNEQGIYQERADGYLAIPDGAAVTVGSGDMTVELWTSSQLPPTGELVAAFKALSNGTNREWCFSLFSNAFNIFASSDAVNWTLVSAQSVSANDTYNFHNGAPRHWAYVKNGSTWSLYINGDKCTNTLSLATAANSTTPIQVSAFVARGRTDEFRLTMGTARYTAGMFGIVCRRFPRE